MRYVGLTDTPERSKNEHGNPADWEQRSFNKEGDARGWEKVMLVHPQYQGSPGGKGWRYGYTFTISPETRQ